MKSLRILIALAAASTLAAACHHHNPKYRSAEEEDAARRQHQAAQNLDKDTQAGIDDAQKEAQAGKDEVDAALNGGSSDSAGTVKENASDAAKKIAGAHVTAEVTSIDRNAKKVTFRLPEKQEELELQAGHELTVDFERLPLLTGLKEDAALEKMHEGKDVTLSVVGRGTATTVVGIDFPDETKTQKPKMPD